MRSSSLKADAQRKPRLHALIAGGSPQPCYVSLSSVPCRARLHPRVGQSLVERGSYLVNAVDGLRRLPHAARARRLRHGQALLRRLADLGREGLHGQGLEHHARPRNRDRRVERGGSEAPDGQGVRPNGVPIAPQHPYAFYKILTPRDLDAIAALHPLGGPGEERGAAACIQSGDASALHTRRGEAVRRGGAGRSGQARFLPRHHRALHGSAIRAVRTGPRTSRAGTARAATR